MKIAINTCFGGFSLSPECFHWLVKNKDWRIGNDKEAEIKAYQSGTCECFSLKKYNSIETRTNPDLIEAIEKLGSEIASGPCSKIEILEIPDGYDIEIHEYDGKEYVAEKHKKWG